MPSKKELLDADAASSLLDLRIEYLKHIVEGHVCSTNQYRFCPDEEGGCGEWSCKRFSDGLCDTCAHRAAYKADPRRIKQRVQEYGEKNKKRILKAKRKLYHSNPAVKERQIKNAARWAKTHRRERRAIALTHFVKKNKLNLNVFSCDDCGHSMTSKDLVKQCNLKKCGSRKTRIIHYCHE